jgi:hypothetical protein
MEKSRVLSREAKLRRRQPCIRGCGTLTSYDSVSGVCQDCYRAEHAADHGSPGMYSDGCRCAECREGQRQRHAEWAKRVRGNPPEHGTTNAYRNYGCRCEACRAIGSIENAYYNERRRRAAS